LQGYGHNYTRGWHWEDAYYTPLPYARTGPGNANDGGLKFDLTQYNQGYFDRLHGRAEEAGNRGMYISIMLFEGWSIDNAWSSGNPSGYRNPNPWPYHPYHVNNNVNEINGDPNGDNDGGEIHQLLIQAVTSLQEDYVEKAIDEFNDLDNIIWEISNESRYYSVSWQYHMVNHIRSYEASKPKQHLIWMNARGDWNNSALFNGPADIVSPNNSSGTDYKTNPPATTGNKIIMLDTDHLWGVGGDKVWVWKSFTRGYQPIYMDPIYPITWSTNTWNPNNPQYIGARQAMGYALSYAERMDLSGVTPQSSSSSTPSSTGYCLYNSGEQYIVYQPGTGQFTVDLPAKIYGYEWFDPETGTVEDIGTIVWGGGNYTFTPPFDGRAVLFVTDEPVAPVPVINANPISGFSPLHVDLDGSGSYDPSGGTIVSYEWDFTSDGSFDSTSAVTSNDYRSSRLRVFTARLKVTDNDGYSGSNTVDITVDVNQICDFDNDGDVDQEDFGHFQKCMSGTGEPQNDPDCLDALLDDDDDVDLADFVIFQGCMSGPNIPADPNCAD
ncbi:MAG: hypothetical protein JSV03_17140, partial [Planctomycetota bacterium]